MRPVVVDWLDAVLPSSVAAAIAPSWFTCVGLAGLVALVWMLALARRHCFDPAAIASLVLWCYVAAVGAGIVVPMLLEAAQQLVGRGRIQLRWAGMTSFWGYLAGAAAVAAVCRVQRLSLPRLGDLSVAPLGAALALARLGCFLGGCDYGKVTAAPWGLRFPAGSPAWHDHVNAGLVPAERSTSLAVHPTQLYEAALGVAIIAVAHIAARRGWARGCDGRCFVVAAAIYAIGRIAIESLRGDASRGIYAGLSSGQIFSLAVLAVIFAAGLLQLVRHRRAALAAASFAALVVLAGTQPAQAQPSARNGPPLPPSQQPPGATPPAQQPWAPQPADPYDTPVGYPAPPPPDAAASGNISLQVGALLGVAAPLNRRPEQVAMLAGPSISVGLVLQRFTISFDLDSFGNTDASHGTALVSAGVIGRVSPRLAIGGRAGVGATLVNFDEPAFRDVAGASVRVEAVAEYELGESWLIWLRPLSFDMLSAAALGGPIVTWQLRIGAGYQFGGRRSRPQAPGAATPPGGHPQPAVHPAPPPPSYPEPPR